MARIKTLLILYLFPCLLLGACLNLKQPRNKTAFYTLEYDSPLKNGVEALPYSIGLERFSVAPVYNSNLIIYRDGSFRRASYTYHKWRANPGDLITYFLARDMKTSGFFKAVLPQDSGIQATHTLEGSVEEFFELDTAETWSAVLTLSITLMVEDEPDISKRILYQKTYGAVKGCKQRDPQALAEAMSHAMAEVSEQIIRDARNRLMDVP